MNAILSRIDYFKTGYFENRKKVFRKNIFVYFKIDCIFAPAIAK